MAAPFQLSLQATLDGLPPGASALLDGRRTEDFGLGPEWFQNFVENGLPASSRAVFALMSEGSTAAAIMPLQEDADGNLGSLTNCYTCHYVPAIGNDLPLTVTASQLGRSLGGLCATQTSLRLDALPAEWPGLGPLVAGIRQGGMMVRRFAHFGNWREPLEGRNWVQYLGDRPGHLRELLRRKGRQAAREARLEFEIIRDAADLPRGAAAFETVYRQSWKPAEPFPQFNHGLMWQAARVGALWLGVAWRGQTPVAVQLWIVNAGRATVMKLAHDATCAALSPGTLLTAEIIEALITHDIETIDFGRGDDPYKRAWAGLRRQRIGLVLFNPRRVRGLAEAARHDLGAALRKARGAPRAVSSDRATR